MAPVAIAMVPAFISGTISSWLPDNKRWNKALKDYPETNMLLRIVTNPGLAEDTAILEKIASFTASQPAWTILLLSTRASFK